MYDETDEWKEKYYEMAKRMIQIMTEIRKVCAPCKIQRNYETGFCWPFVLLDQ